MDRAVVVVVAVFALTVAGCAQQGCRLTGHVQDVDNDDECSVTAVCDGHDVEVECHDRGDFLDCVCASDHDDAVAAYVVSAPICFGEAGFGRDARQFLADACVDRAATFPGPPPPSPCERGQCCDFEACAFFDQTCDVDVDSATVDQCIAIDDDCGAGRDVLGRGRDPSGPAIFEAGASFGPDNPDWRFAVRLSQPTGRIVDMNAEWSDGGAVAEAVVVESNIGGGGDVIVDVVLPLPQSAPRAVRLVTQVGKSNTLCARSPL